MAGNFNFNFKLGDGHASSPAAPAPVLRPYELFATRIWQARMPNLAPHLQSWIGSALAQRAAHPSPAGRTNRGGWNSEDMAVLDQPALALMQQAVQAACSSALSEMGLHERFRLQAWINIHDRGGFNFLHVHEGSLLSGSFYLKVPPGSGKLVFRDPRPGVVHGQVKGALPNGYSDVQLLPEAGLLVLFPCWLEHFVEPHESDEPRIAIAFNAARGA